MATLAQTVHTTMTLFAWAPKGYREMIKLPRFQHLSMWGVRKASLTKNQLNWTELYNVTETINRSAMYAVDQPGKDTWGPWKLVNGLRSGDCDDYAVHKLQRLIAMKYPRGALRLAVCRVGHFESYHCVLLVYLSNGDAVILDNRTDALWLKSKRKDYKWVSEECPGRDFWWSKLS